MPQLAHDPAVHYGRSHEVLPPDDDDALADFFAEQRARVEVLRRNRLWDWIGGVPLRWAHPRWLLYGVWAEMASAPLLVLTILAAGFTHGPVLWSLAGLTVACFLVGRLLQAIPNALSIAHHRRAEVFPIAIFAHGTKRVAEQEFPYFHALVGLDVRTWKDLRKLVSQAERLESLVAGHGEAPPELRDWIEQLRAEFSAQVCDGSRLAVPAASGLGDAQVLRAGCGFDWLPERKLDSRVLFVLADRRRLAPDRLQLLYSQLWGTGAPSLRARFPLERRA